MSTNEVKASLPFELISDGEVIAVVLSVNVTTGAKKSNSNTTEEAVDSKSNVNQLPFSKKHQVRHDWRGAE